MNLAKLDELLEQLEAERSSGREPSIEELCADCPEMIVHLRERIESHSFSEVQRTRAESTHEVKRKLSTMPENLTGHRLVVQSDLKIEEYVDRGGLGDVYRAGDDAERWMSEDSPDPETACNRKVFLLSSLPYRRLTRSRDGPDHR